MRELAGFVPGPYRNRFAHVSQLWSGMDGISGNDISGNKTAAVMIQWGD